MDKMVEDDAARQAAAHAAASAIRDGMRVGLGSGATAEMFIRALALRVHREKLRIQCTAATKRSETLAADLDIPLASLNELIDLDVMVDSANEFDRELRLIKGGSGGLLQEKILATASRRRVFIVDDGKEVAWLGSYPLPVEVSPFGARATQLIVEETLTAAKLLNKPITLRMQGRQPYMTDHGNHVLDLHLGRIPDPAALAQALSAIPGVIEHGLFLGMVDRLLIGYGDGRVDIRRR